MGMMAANLICGVLCLIIGLVVQTGKANFLIAGFNTMSEKEQAKWDMEAVSKFLGRVLLIIPSLILLIACIPVLLDIFPYVAMAASWIIFTLILVGGVIYVNLNPRFKRPK